MSKKSQPIFIFINAADKNDSLARQGPQQSRALRNGQSVFNILPGMQKIPNQRDDPRLRGQPVIVGASPTRRSAVCATSCEARTFEVRSALPASRRADSVPRECSAIPSCPRH